MLTVPGGRGNKRRSDKLGNLDRSCRPFSPRICPKKTVEFACVFPEARYSTGWHFVGEESRGKAAHLPNRVYWRRICVTRPRFAPFSAQQSFPAACPPPPTRRASA